MNDTILKFFVGGFEKVYDPITSKIDQIFTLLNTQGKQIMATLEKVQILSSKLDELVTAAASEREQVASALTVLSNEFVSLNQQIADLKAQIVNGDPEVLAALDAQTSKVESAINDVKAIYVEPEQPAV